MHQSLATQQFRSIYDANFGAIRRYCYRRVPTEQVEDAVADVFLVVWRRIGSAPPGDEATLWIYGIARNVVRNHTRTRYRRERLRGRLTRSAIETGTDASVQVLRRIEDQEILDALAQLRPADQEILRLAAWEELKPAEIGQVLGIQPHAASMRLQRARYRLARLLGMSEKQPIPRRSPRSLPNGGRR